MTCTRKIILGFVMVSVVVVAAVAIIAATNAPKSSGVEVKSCITAADSNCARFPTVSGANLVGDTFNLPDDFGGTLTLVLMPFDEAQTVRLTAWLPLAQELASAYPQFAYYSTPVMKSVAPLIRAAVTAGMVLAVPANVQPVTIMLFLEDKEAFMNTLSIPDVDMPEAFLINDDGDVLWRMRGEYSDETAANLRAAIALQVVHLEADS
ncbi:MAG: hypothetical protein IAE89_00500 [Anaerolineae bacterium]|nr:hypothetical protein [Anaerolineae bacterium]